MTDEKKIRTLVVDDEELARDRIQALLAEQPDVEIVGVCTDGPSAVEAIDKAQPDLVFLDVQMPECDGFDVLELLGRDRPPVAVFVTAHDEYALRAFEAGALDYLVKPFTDARFQRALERAKQRFVLSKEVHRPSPEALIVKSAGQVLFVNVADIDWIDAANYYACLHVGPHTHILRRSLADLEQELQSGPFCRIHRSTIVNVHRIRGLELMDDGEYAVILKSGSRLRLSRRFRKSLQQRLGMRGR